MGFALGVIHGADGEHFCIHLATLAPVPDFAVPDTFVDQTLPHLVVKRFALTPGAEDAGVAAHHLFAVVACDAGECLVDIDDFSVEAGDGDALSRMSEHTGGQPKLFVNLTRLPELGLQLVPLGFHLLAKLLSFQQVVDALAGDTHFQGLGDVVGSTQCEACRFGQRITLACHKHHRNVLQRFVGLEPSARFIAVHAWHQHVQQDEIRLVFFGQGQTFSPGTGRAHDKVVLQGGLEQLQIDRCVVDGQDAGSVEAHALIFTTCRPWDITLKTIGKKVARI